MARQQRNKAHPYLVNFVRSVQIIGGLTLLSLMFVKPVQRAAQKYAGSLITKVDYANLNDRTGPSAPTDPSVSSSYKELNKAVNANKDNADSLRVYFKVLNHLDKATAYVASKNYLEAAKELGRADSVRSVYSFQSSGK